MHEVLVTVISTEEDGTPFTRVHRIEFDHRYDVERWELAAVERAASNSGVVAVETLSAP